MMTMPFCAREEVVLERAAKLVNEPVGQFGSELFRQALSNTTGWKVPLTFARTAREVIGNCAVFSGWKNSAETVAEFAGLPDIEDVRRGEPEVVLAVVDRPEVVAKDDAG